MNRLIVSFIFVSLFIFQSIIGQEKFTLYGTVTQAYSNETLIGVSITVTELQTGVNTNEYGFYSITLPKGSYKLLISYIGFKNINKSIDLTKNTALNLQLTEQIEELEKVIITGNIEKLDIKKPQMSVNTLSAGSIKKIPAILGEADVLKSILLLPGVTSVGEGASGFNVRGGSADQNLILLDEATIFNSSHLLGLFSVFNPDAIKDLKLYKGGIPAKYGGRISSVLNIYQKEGNSKNFNANGGIGIVSSRLLLEGPLKKDRVAFLFGGRSSYVHLFLPLFNNDNKAYFYDLNSKLNYRLNKNNNLYASAYFGRDVFSIDNIFMITYGNSILNLRWNHLYYDKLFSNLSLIYSDYFYGSELYFVGLKWNSGIRNFNLKYDFKHYIYNNLKLNYGVNNTYYRFNPGEIEPNRSNSGILPRKLTDKYANEFAAYIDAEHKVSQNLMLQYGVRWSNFIRLGQKELFVYENNNAVNFNTDFQIYKSAKPIGIENFKRKEHIANFNNLEPRLLLSYTINNLNSIKISYNHMVQYLHLLSNTSSATPLDIWAASGKFIKPQILDQYAVGYFKNFKNAQYSLETEAFYKDVKNRIDYIDGANLIANDAIEQVILSGKMRAYGLEVMFKKNNGKLNGWLSYTLSRSEQQTPGRTILESGINNGKWYSTTFDKTHDISLNTNYDLNDKWSFNSNLIFQTGQPTNYPSGKFKYKSLDIPIYNGRNQQRLSNYHRIDISATLTPKKNRNRKLQSQWVFSIYNIYNRKNAASINFRKNKDSSTNEALRTSIFGAVPSITYNFKF